MTTRRGNRKYCRVGGDHKNNARVLVETHCRIAAAVDKPHRAEIYLAAEGGYTVLVPEYACPICSIRKSGACESQRG